MDKKLIGTKADINAFVAVLIVVAGVAVMAGGILFFLFVIGGAIGGGVAGFTIACGAMLCMLGVGACTLPKELVFIDDKSLYLHKTTIELKQIKAVKSNGMSLVIIPHQGKQIRQGLLKNSEDCAKQIADKSQQPMA